MNNEKPINLEELQNRVDIEEEAQLEEGILIEAPHGWFKNIQHQVETPHLPMPPKPDGPAH